MSTLKKYNIGLDIGTNSVGWAVVEAGTQKIIRKGRGKDTKRLWGVRLFDSANTAAERREARSTRRRYERRRERIRLLQGEFSDEILKVDPNFYVRLKETFYKKKDIQNKKHPFSEEEKNIIKKEYLNKYKTIYHLRKDLMETDKKFDIRLVYLAIHHIIKYRGNFLYSNDNFNVNDLDIESKIKDIFDAFEIDFSLISIEKLKNGILNESYNDRKIIIKDILGDYVEKNFVSEFINAISGRKFNVNKMFDIEEDEKKTLAFSDDTFDKEYDNCCFLLGDDIEKLNLLKELYDMIFLKKIFKDSNNVSISALMVEKYQTHKQDLKYLKTLFDQDRVLYRKVFRTNKNRKNKCLYDKYLCNELSYDEFTKNLMKEIEKVLANSDPAIVDFYNQNVKPRIEYGKFLPKTNERENGVFPYQLNKYELEKIIANQGKYYSFLLEKVDSKYKIVKLLEFKIPYYVGPLVDSSKSKYAWLKRKVEKVKITPYNFDTIVNKEETAEKFIKRMVGHCTYFLGETAIASNSILYSKFKVMNELKQIRICGNLIDNDIQHKILENLFMKKSGTITDKIFKEYLYRSNDFNEYNGNFTVTGYSADEKFANNMQSYVDFFGNDGIFENTNYNEEDAEKIIEWITIFEDKSILKLKLAKEYPKLTENQVRKIIKKKYKGWGSLSKSFLTEKYYFNEKDSQKYSIIDLMFTTKDNFMQILNNDKYKFQNMIKEHNLLNDNRTTKDIVSELATSPQNKRGIYQALQVVHDIVKFMKYDPDAIIIEMARGSNSKKVRTDDKKKKILKLYENAKKDIVNCDYLIKELSQIDEISQKYFLYFIQEGKSIYSGKPIDINHLEECEIDHIVPQSLIKDDSIDNKVLAYINENQTKSDSYTVPSEYSSKNKEWWRHLKKCGMMSAKKFYNLTRKAFSDEDIEGFINRQLVETRQITKHVANILSNLYDKSKVVYINANLSYNYRDRYELFKFRINDYHHAHDAYLAAVLGEYKEKFLKRKVNLFELQELNKSLNKYQNSKKFQYGYVVNSLDSTLNLHVDTKTGEVKFDTEHFNKTVEFNLYCNDILVSKKTEIYTGAFWKKKLYPKGVGKIKIKENLPTELYGGYSNMNTSYSILVEYKKKKRMLGIPVDVVKRKLIDNFIREHLNLKDNDTYKIIYDKIPFNTLIDYNNQKVYIKGYSVAKKAFELANANELKVSKSNLIKWKYTLYKIYNNKDILNFDKTPLLNDEEYLNQAKDILLFLFKAKEKYPLFYKEVDNIEKELNIELLAFEDLSRIIKEFFKLYGCDSVNANLQQYYKDKNRVGRLSGKAITSGIIKNVSPTALMRNDYEF